MMLHGWGTLSYLVARDGTMRLFGIVLQIILLMALVVALPTYFLFHAMYDSASRVVVDHEKVDLDEETQLQGWQLLSRIDLLRQDARHAADVLLRATDTKPGAVTPAALARALPDSLLERYLRVEAFPLKEDGKVPQGLVDRCDAVSAAEKHPAQSRKAMLERVRRQGLRQQVILAPKFARERDPFEMKVAALAELRRRDAAGGDANPALWPRNYNVLWAGVRIHVPRDAPDDTTDWVLLIALGLDETLRDIAGSPRHLGLLFDDLGTLYLHPTRSHELAPNGTFDQPLQEPDDLLARPLRDFTVVARHPCGMELARKDLEPRQLQGSRQFYFSETSSVLLGDKKDEKKVLAAGRVLRELNNAYLEKELSGGTGSHVPLRRVSGLQPGMPRIRVLATSVEDLDAVLNEIQRLLHDDPEVGLSQTLAWGVAPIRCDRYLASQVRIPLRLGGEPNGPNAAEPGIGSLTLVRAVFHEELSADLAAELSGLRWKALFGGGVALLAAVALSILVIARPLRLITRAAVRIARAVGGAQAGPSPELDGYLGRLPVRWPGEIGDLARTFRAMVTTLRESEAFQRCIIDTAADGILTIDETGRVLSFNPAAEKLFGLPRAEAVGRHFEILFPDPVAEQLKGLLAKCLAQAESKLEGSRQEVVGRRRLGDRSEEFPLELSISEVGQDGRRIFIALLRDLTERRQAEHARALGARAVALSEANAEKTHALRGIAHETIADLTAILLSVNQYRTRFGPGLTPEQCKVLDRIDRSGRSLQEFVHGLQDIARLADGKVKLELEDFSPGTVILEELDKLQPVIEAKGLRLRTDLDSAPHAIQAEKARFRQIVRNLLSNACKYTPHGGDVTVRAVARGDDLWFEVEDTGIGIPEKDRDRIFTLFGRTENAKRHADGQGLGLALCQRLVEMHHGGIAFTSAEGEGSTFRVWLPVRQAAAEGHEPGEATGPVPGGCRILLADPNAPRAQAIRNLLEEDGHTVEVIDDGERLIERAVATRFDIVLTVPRLNRLNAPDAVARLREAGHGLPVVLLALAEVADVRSRGFAALVLLPVDRARLRQALIDSGVEEGPPAGGPAGGTSSGR